VNGLGQIAAEATLGDLPYYRENFRRLIRTRTALTRDLTSLGFEVLPSQTNFLFARPPRFAARTWLDRLRERKLLVRWFDSPEVRDYLRIAVGTDAEAAALVKGATAILRPASSRIRRSGP
jgi:histidinol-phosphate aminotransferase